MNNVIAFPRPAEPKSNPDTSNRSMTLFLHVKCATLIVHLANPATSAARAGKVVKS